MGEIPLLCLATPIQLPLPESRPTVGTAIRHKDQGLRFVVAGGTVKETLRTRKSFVAGGLPPSRCHIPQTVAFFPP